MANIKSAKKRILVTAKRQARNKHVKSFTKTAIKKFTLAANAGN
ncbi:MAG: 30S ribosomal protein S20, partial [Defluviitaleaceae bacterium]|nr:30S ribosomal protein S20 [Defluviitaleaceae bacterium]